MPQSLEEKLRIPAQKWLSGTIASCPVSSRGRCRGVSVNDDPQDRTGSQWSGDCCFRKGPQHVINVSIVCFLGSRPFLLTLFSCSGRAAVPGNPEEDGSSPRQTSQDDGPRQSRNGEGSQVQWWTCPLGLLSVSSVFMLCWPGEAVVFPNTAALGFPVAVALSLGLASLHCAVRKGLCEWASHGPVPKPDKLKQSQGRVSQLPPCMVEELLKSPNLRFCHGPAEQKHRQACRSFRSAPVWVGDNSMWQWLSCAPEWGMGDQTTGKDSPTRLFAACCPSGHYTT